MTTSENTAVPVLHARSTCTHICVCTCNVPYSGLFSGGENVRIIKHHL